jgi:DNA-binding response OmpR family regulator
VERILVVEDDDGLREDLVLALQGEDYEVTGCASGVAALELAYQQTFDLVISDVRMAGMDGLDTLERLQQQQPSVATLVITGFAAEADSIRAVRLGVGDYLKKPFRLDEFLQAVARQLSLHKLRQARQAREQALARVAVWGLEAVAGNQASRDARLARATGAELGLADEVALQAQLALLSEAAMRQAPDKYDPAELPAEVRRVLDEVRQELVEGEALGLAARLARLARYPDEGDAALRAAWTRAQQSASPGGNRRRRQFLLQSGRTHEAAGEAAAALARYQELIRDEEPSRERVEALLGCMRLAPPPQRPALATAAVELAASLSPLLQAVTCLEAGLWLQRSPEAVGLFSEAQRLARSLAQPTLEAKATLALAGAGQKVDVQPALARMLESDERHELLDSAWWLASCLLRLPPDPLLERLLARLGRESPGAFQRLVAGSRLEPSARMAIVRALQGSSHPTALECLRQLGADVEAGVREAAARNLSQAPAPASPLLRIRCFGGLQVERADQPVPDKAFRSLKQRFLLARLACAPRPVPVERLIDELWPDDAEGGRASLNVSVSHLRKLLRGGVTEGGLDPIVREGAGIWLNPELPLWHDYTELWSVPAPGDGVPDEATVAAWKSAVQLYRGPYLEICYLDWAVGQRERTELFVLQLLRKLVTCLSPAETLEYAGRLLELDNCCQEGHLALMRASVALGQPEAAVRQFEAAKRTLHKELGMEPSIALLEAHQRALLSLG